ncbi:MAG: YIP1 family protein [Clostridia bacterium]|nr:YIP1 family protein [Clostridia bacterium]
MKQAFNILRHPIYGHWEMKRDNTGRYADGIVILLIAIAASIFNRQARAFVFNMSYNVPLDILKQAARIVLPVMLFSVSNWAVTTLYDGNGTFKDVFLVCCYSLLPFIFFRLLTPILSHLLTLNETLYLNLIDMIGYGWTGVMLFVGIKEVHEYEAGKMLLTIFITAVGAAIIIFIFLLFFSLLQELGSFVYSIYRELSLRL